MSHHVYRQDEPAATNPSARSRRSERDFATWVLLRRSTNAMERVREKELHQHGMTLEQASVFHAVWQLREEATPAAISRWLLRTSQSTTELLSRMAGQGLIKKTKDPDNKKRIIVTLTSLGLKKYRAARGRQSLSEVLSVFSDEEIDTLHGLLRRFRDKAYEQLGFKAGMFPDPTSDALPRPL